MGEGVGRGGAGVQRARRGGFWVYFWTYSLHSERAAVGARQLWRQRVIVARRPDRPKMAELTGTGGVGSEGGVMEGVRFTLCPRLPHCVVRSRSPQKQSDGCLPSLCTVDTLPVDVLSFLFLR